MKFLLFVKKDHRFCSAKVEFGIEIVANKKDS